METIVGDIFLDARKEAREEGREEGREEARKEMRKAIMNKMRQLGYSESQIQEIFT